MKPSEPPQKTLLDQSGKPIPPKPEPKSRKIRSLISSSYTKWIAISAFVMSVFNFLGTCETRRMQRIVNQLEPVIKLRAADGLTSFRIENIGAVDAYNVRVQPIAHRYYESLDRIAISSASMENLLQVKTLSPFQPVTNRIDRFFLVNEAKMQQPENHNIIELRVNYRKRNEDQDYTLSTYYFFSPEGKWVSEVSAENFDDPIYEKMLSAVLGLSDFGVSTIDYYSRSPSDRLHIRE